MNYLFFFFFAIAMAQSPKESINQLLDNWHQAAATANFDRYFRVMDEQSIFIGTDATEHWNKKAFQEFSKPFFDRGKAWNFTALERHIYLAEDGKSAWFDELLNTQMKLCRGSGIVVLTSEGWKIKHYVLSMTVPNDATDAVVKIKTPFENPVIDKLILEKK